MLIFYEVQVLAGIIVGLCYLGLQAARGNILARWILLALGLVGLGTINDILLTHHLITGIRISPYTLMGFVLVQSGILSGTFARAFHKAEHLSENLQKEVEAQTQDLNLVTQIRWLYGGLCRHIQPKYR